MQTMTCRARQAVQIGEEVEIAVLSVEAGVVRLRVTAPSDRRLTRIDPVPLPAGASEIYPASEAARPAFAGFTRTLPDAA